MYGCASTLLCGKGPHFGGDFSYIILTLCPMVFQRSSRATNILIKLKAHKHVVYFPEFSVPYLLSLTMEAVLERSLRLCLMLICH